jgi:hypothetical protein
LGPASEGVVTVARSLPLWFLGLFLAVLLFAPRAEAAVTLCVVTKAEPSALASLTKLVLSEVASHPSHRMVEKDCESRLVVEIFQVDQTRFLTVQLDGQVPSRHAIANDAELAPKISEAVSLSLGNDPVVLSEDPSRFGTMERAKHSVLVRGTNLYQLETFEVMARTDRNVAFAPGMAFSFTRGADQYAIFARTHVAGWPFPAEGQARVLKVMAGLDAGVLWETNKRAWTSPYLAAGAGLVLMRFEGRVDASDSRSADAVDRVGATINLRGGLHLLRAFDFQADLFLSGRLPLFLTRELDHELFGENGVYTPTLEAGIGIGF